jgi:predicted enzyme related to lactoylglutathione lyase
LTSDVSPGGTVTVPYICHVEWGTPDPEALQGFLSELFGWEFQSLAPGYRIHLPAEGGPSIGILRSDQMRAGGSPSASVRVVDLDAVLRRAEQLGGKVVAPSTPLGTGAFAFIAAPDANLIGLQQV